MNLTEQELHILQHSLGVNKYGQGNRYRNRFITDRQTEDGMVCTRLCAAGLMKDHGPQSLAGGMVFFSVTEEGVRAMAQQSPTPPKLSRSQRRYREFLDADLGITFAEYLRLPSKL